MNTILIIDDDPDIGLLLKNFFKKKGFDTHAVKSGDEGIAFIKEKRVDVIICDFKLPKYTGVEILQKIKIIQCDAQVIIITGYSDVRIAVEALKKGAFDYVTKPLYPDEILLTVNNALESTPEDVEDVEKPRRKTAPKKSSKSDYVSGQSQQSKQVTEHVKLIAPTDMSVIILGETGTGKEFVAREIHKSSKRADMPFVAVDCGALPAELAASELFGHIKGAFTGAVNDKKGCFEAASGGTLFLDELGNLSYENQIKLLRVLQERVVKKVGSNQTIPVDVRVIAATNEDLRTAVLEGEFREDIYHRLNEFCIKLSPLRERPDDITLFANHFLNLANQQLQKNVLGFDEQVIDLLKKYHWHGNLRELANVVKRSVLLAQKDLVDFSCLPDEIINPDYTVETNIAVDGDNSLKDITEMAEKTAIMNALEKSNHNKSKTAEFLGIDRKTLYNKLKTYNIDSAR